MNIVCKINLAEWYITDVLTNLNRSRKKYTN